MSADSLFSIVNLVAATGWLILIVAGARFRSVPDLITGRIIPLLLAIVYTALIVTNWGSGGGFGSIAEVRELFSNDWLLLAGWVHYLAFDLFVGSWQVRDSQKHGIPHLVLIPVLILTFLFGPAGLMLYTVVRLGKKALQQQQDAKPA
jgi:hypothetical protein